MYALSWRDLFIVTAASRKTRDGICINVVITTLGTIRSLESSCDGVDNALTAYKSVSHRFTIFDQERVFGIERKSEMCDWAFVKVAGCDTHGWSGLGSKFMWIFYVSLL